MSRLRRLVHTLLLLPLVTSFIVATVMPPTFCPVTSPTEQQVYVTDTPSKLILGATRTQCALECKLNDAISGLQAGRQPGCRCFNYNSTSTNCSIFAFEPTSYEIDQQGNSVAYQFADRPPGLQELWSNVSRYNCSFPFVYRGLLYCQQCASSSVFVNDRMCARKYDSCELINGEQAFCSDDVIVTTLTSPINVTGLPSSALKPTDCTDIAALGCRDNGVYTIYVGVEQRPLSVFCDMTTVNTSWTMFQRRMDGSVNFYRPWNDYAIGFGSLRGEFWLGNDNLNLLTSAKRYKLRIDMSKMDGTTRYAEYDNFTVNSSADKYRLMSLGGFRGTTGDSLTNGHLAQQFSTYNVNNQGPNNTANCAKVYKGAWWYGAKYCHQSNLNGYYYGGPHSSFADGVEWSSWTGQNYSLKTTEMKIQPVV